MLLFLLQAVLVATRRTNLHRRVGVAGAVIAVAFVITGCWMFVQHAARGFDLSGDLMPGGSPIAPEVALVPVTQVVLFGILVGAAIWYRHRPPIHKRLMLITMAGHTVRVAHDGLSAVAVAGEFRPDVVLLDLGLPGKDGYAVINDLRAIPATATATIVATTGYGREEDRARCLTAGFDDHMPPTPICAPTSYGPRQVPGVRAKCCGLYGRDRSADATTLD